MKKEPDISDSVLVETYKKGDKPVFEVIYARYKDKIYGLLFYLCHDRAQAEDLTQQVFLKAFVALDGYRGQASLGTWLSHIATNIWIDESRKRKRSPLSLVKAMTSDLQDRGASPEGAVLNRELSQALITAIANLSDKLRVVFVLKYIAGLSYSEISEILGCSTGTVGSRLTRCLKTLARDLNRFREGN